MKTRGTKVELPSVSEQHKLKYEAKKLVAGTNHWKAIEIRS